MRTLNEKRSRNLVAGLSIFAVVASVSPTRARAEAYFADEASPDEIAAELGAELGGPGWQAGDDPGDRLVRPEDFGKYQIVVDVFRQSAKRPVLGSYQDGFLDAAASTFKEKSEAARKKLAKARFAKLANTEFLVISVDGSPLKANLVSGALEKEIEQVVKKGNLVQYDPVTKEPLTKKSKKYTPFGNFKLSAIRRSATVPSADGKTTETKTLPYAFPTSETYESAMYWGLKIFGGYLLHSTPHTYQLGRPASMGCVRQSFPDAMELWNFVANLSEGREAMIRIHEMHSLEAYTRLREIVYDPAYSPNDPKYELAPEQIAATALPSSERDLAWLVGQLNTSYSHIKDYIAKYGNEHHGMGHAWIDPTTRKAPKPVFPLCGGYDCVKVWGNPLKRLAAKIQKNAEANQKNREALGIGVETGSTDADPASGTPAVPAKN